MEIVPFDPRLPTPLEVGLPTPFPGLGLVSGSSSGLGLGLVRSLGREEAEDNESFSKLFLIIKVIHSNLGTFPQDFPQVATSQGYFPKWQLPKCAISQAATSQVCPSRSAQPSVCSSRGARSLGHSSRSARSPLQPAAHQRA